MQLLFQFTTNTSYLPNAVCCLLLYDLTQDSSFSSLHSHLSLASQLPPDLAFLYLLGNKLDLAEEDAREVDFDRG